MNEVFVSRFWPGSTGLGDAPHLYWTRAGLTLEYMLLNVGLLAIEALLIGLIAIVLHASSHRYGLAPLLIFLTGLVAVLHAVGATPVFIDAWGTRVAVSDSVIVPVILVSVLLLYEVHGTAIARVTIVGIVGVSLLVLALQVVLPLHLALPGGFNALGAAGR